MDEIFLPKYFNTDFEGFNFLADISSKLNNVNNDCIRLNIVNTEFIQGNLCSPLGAVLTKCKSNNKVTVVHNESRVKKYLSQNGFLGNINSEKLFFDEGIIQYSKFNLNESGNFFEYVKSNLKAKGIPAMSSNAEKYFYRSFLEIFQNIVDHAKTDYQVHCCGQFFKNFSSLKFSITDLGIGFKSKIAEYLKKEISAVDAIDWALKSGNSTKNSASIPSGFGLKDILNFVNLNGGSLKIVSGDGYVEVLKTKKSYHKLDNIFQGTIITIEFNTADTSEYILSSEANV